MLATTDIYTLYVILICDGQLNSADKPFLTEHERVDNGRNRFFSYTILRIHDVLTSLISLCAHVTIWFNLRTIRISPTIIK